MLKHHIWAFLFVFFFSLGIHIFRRSYLCFFLVAYTDSAQLCSIFRLLTHYHIKLNLPYLSSTWKYMWKSHFESLYHFATVNQKYVYFCFPPLIRVLLWGKKKKKKSWHCYNVLCRACLTLCLDCFCQFWVHQCGGVPGSGPCGFCILHSTVIWADMTAGCCHTLYAT